MANDPPLPNARRTNELSRRDMGRWAALSAVAATMCGRAEAQGKSPLDIDDLVDIGTPCRNFLHLIGPDTTVEDILFNPFQNILDIMITRLDSGAASVKDPGGYIKAGLADLKKHVDDHYGSILHLKHIYTYDQDESHPQIGGLPANWGKIYEKCRADGLRYNLAMPFLTLPKRSASKARLYIEALITDPKFVATVGPIHYVDLFIKKRSDVFDFSNKDGFDTYRLVRQAFKLGLFDYSVMQTSSPFGDDMTAQIIPNGKCYSESQDTCVQVVGSYCQMVDGQPTSSSSVCP